MSPGRPWVGRDAELARVISALTQDDDHRGAVIAGPAGVGKTRLAAEAGTRVAARAWSVHSFVATASAKQLPLGVFAGLKVPSSGADPFRAVGAVLDGLLSGADGSRTVVAVDDVHQLDEVSALVVHQLVHKTSAHVLLTLRIGEPASETVSALWANAFLDRVDLAPLTARESAALMRAVLDGPVDPSATRKLWELTQGNVLYARRIIDDERRAGRLTVGAGTWSWRGGHVLSPTLAELIATQMGSVPDDVADVVDLLAVAEPLPFAAVRRSLGAAPIERAEAAGLIAASPPARPEVLRLAHPLYGDVRRDVMGPVRAARLRGIAAGMLSTETRTIGLGVDSALRRAVLTSTSDLPPDAELFLAGAREASRLLQLALSERLAAASAAAGGGTDAIIVRALAVSLMSRGEDARDLLAAASWDGPDPYRVALATIRAGNLFFDLGDISGATAVLDEAAARVGDPAVARGLAGPRTAILAFGGAPAAAITAAGSADGAVDMPPIASVLLHWGSMLAHGDRGDVAGMQRHVHQALAVTEADPGVAMLRYPVVMTYEATLLNLGEISRAHEVTADALANLSDLPGGPQAMSATMVGLSELGRGQLPAAVDHLALATAMFEAADDTAGWLLQTLRNLTRAVAQTGDAERARRTYENLLAHPHTGFRCYESEIHLAHAWVAAAYGTVTVARHRALAAAGTARDRGQLTAEVLALQTAVRFGDRECAARLTELALVVDGRRAELAARHASALAGDDGAALRALARELESTGDLLTAADAAAQASTLLRAQGLLGSALSAAAEARRLADACGGATSPALAAMEAPAALSEREREVALLIARGLSNRAIADTLVVSVRTVEGHVYRASAKVGASTRSELARLVADA